MGNDTMKQLGLWLYMGGFFGSIAVGVLEYYNALPNMTWLPIASIVLGLAIGLLNITEKEAMPLMLAALVIGAATGILAVLPSVGGLLEAVFLKIAALSLPVALPVGIKTFYEKIKN